MDHDQYTKVGGREGGERHNPTQLACQAGTSPGHETSAPRTAEPLLNLNPKTSDPGLNRKPQNPNPKPQILGYIDAGKAEGAKLM